MMQSGGRQQKVKVREVLRISLKRVRLVAVASVYLESLGIKHKWFTQSPKGENYNQFQPSLSIQHVYM